MIPFLAPWRRGAHTVTGPARGLMPLCLALSVTMASAAAPVNPAGNRFTDTGIKRHICLLFYAILHHASIWLYFYFYFW